MFDSQLLEQCKSAIMNANKIAVFSHESVDGDAVGSLLGLGVIYEKLGKEVGLFTTITPGKAYHFLPDIGKIRTDFDYSDTRDLIVFVDFNNYSRIAKITLGHEEYFDTKEKVIVDHHLGDITTPHTLVLRDANASSCCELLYEIAKELWPECMDKNIATEFYLGLTTDTGNFQYEKDSVRTMNNAMGLIKLGANKPWIIQNMFNGSDRSSIDLSKMMIPRITRDKHICYARYTSEEIEKLGFDKDEADALILSYLRPLKAIPVIAIIRKETANNKVGMSFRSGFMADGRRIDVQKIATHFGGGGHIYAAGCKTILEDDFIGQVPKLAKEINAEIEKQL